MNDFFSADSHNLQPLADRMRPVDLVDYVGQSHLLDTGKILWTALRQGSLHSMILWGPPGVGKTTLARLLSVYCDAHFMTLSAVLAGIKDIRNAVREAQEIKIQFRRQSILFVDEVHRFNKAQQDAFLPFVEDGTFVFVGATTENPAFELNNALLSRVRVYLLHRLNDNELTQLLQKALLDCDKGLGKLQLTMTTEHQIMLVRAAEGDARRLLDFLDVASDLVVQREDGKSCIDALVLEQVMQASPHRFDKGGDIFYDQISAFHKSVRGSDPDAALYWMARMLDGGCDPLYIARRLLAIASEDIGNADPRALQIVVNAWQAYHRLGPAEGNRAIAHAAVYCACAAKSNAVHLAFKAAMSLVSDTPAYDVPAHLRNAPTTLARSLGHGDDYRYAHNEVQGFAAGESYLPSELDRVRFYKPTDRGLGASIGKKLEWLDELNRKSEKQRYQ
jgi:putative ATPase